MSNAMREAVELTTIVQNCSTLPPEVIRDAMNEALGENPVRALAGQAALTGAVARMAEERLALIFRDAHFLQMASDQALQGRPVTPCEIGCSRQDLIRQAGIAAARIE